MKLSMHHADEVFNNWLKQADSKKVDKNFGVKKEAKTAVENVNIHMVRSSSMYFTNKL